MRLSDALWFGLFSLALLGAGFALAGANGIGVALLGFTAICGATRIVIPRPAVAPLDWGVAALVVAVIAQWIPPFPWGVALVISVLQVILAVAAGRTIGVRAGWGRIALLVAGHASLLVGTLVLLVPGGSGADVAILAYAGGLTVLVLQARWARDADPDWDVALLAALTAGMVAATWHYIGGTGVLTWMEPTRGSALLVACVALVLAILALARPPEAPAWLRARSSSVPIALAHGGAALGLLNVLFVVFSLVALWSARILIAAITVYVALGVAMEYRAIRRARAARAYFLATPPAIPVWPDVTVVIPARNEAAGLAESMSRNLDLPACFRFVLVPSIGSTDGSVAVAEQLAASHPGRIRVVLGTGGSKARDLNLAWPTIDTDLVLMLDADETADATSMAWAVAAMERDPNIGVVQGRKVSRSADATALNRFVATERRHATGLDQTMHAELGSTHFAGSAALVRRNSVERLGGWTDETLTEDIEFTLRAHLGSDERIVYEPRMVVHESDPVDLRALVDQRTRWSRGWAQCFVLYFRPVVGGSSKLGPMRAFGLAWLLLMAVSAPAMVLLPAFVLMRATGIPALLPFAIGVGIAVFILPARLIGYTYSALYDPHIPVPRRATRVAEAVLYAYLWIAVGWVLSLHALYLEIAAAPHEWSVTRKETLAVDSRGRGVLARGVRA